MMTLGTGRGRAGSPLPGLRGSLFEELTPVARLRDRTRVRRALSPIAPGKKWTNERRAGASLAPFIKLLSGAFFPFCGPRMTNGRRRFRSLWVPSVVRLTRPVVRRW